MTGAARSTRALGPLGACRVLAIAVTAALVLPAPASAQFGKLLKNKVKKAVAEKAAEAIAPSATPDTLTDASAGKLPLPETSPSLWVNYDFVPGERVIFYTDFAEDVVGNFPQRLGFRRGNMEVAELGEQRLIRATSHSVFTIPLPEVLPQRFTIEIDFINRPLLDGAAFQISGSAEATTGRATSTIRWGSDGAGLDGGGGGEVPLQNNEANRARYRGKPGHLRIMGDGQYIKVYLDEQRVVNVPNANFERSNALTIVVDARSAQNAAFVGRIRVAESRKSLYDDLAAKGRVATQGILFDTGSDQPRPESAPTFKAIAAMLGEHPGLRLRIEGHTDNVGAAATNRGLSQRRAAAVKTALVQDYRIADERLETTGLGDSKPVASNATVEGRQNNRRVELVRLP